MFIVIVIIDVININWI